MAKLKEGPLGPLFGMLEVGTCCKPFWLCTWAHAKAQMCLHDC